MAEAQFLTGRILLAMPGMFDPNFDHAVIAMCVHDENGALGIGIGHVCDGISFHDILQELGIDPGQAPNCAIHQGGPVDSGRGFVLHSPDWAGEETIAVAQLCCLSASRDILLAIAQGAGPRQWLFALGYAGWGSGQLEEEMRHHGWYASGGHPDVLFDTPAEARWVATWRKEGVDPRLLSSVTGRA